MAVAIAALTGCRKHFPERHNPGGGGSGDGGNGGNGHQTEQTVLNLKENKAWSITYDGRELRNFEEGPAKVEVINVDNIPSNVIYIVSVIGFDDYTNYTENQSKLGEGLIEFMNNELALAKDGGYFYYGSPEEILFDPLRHGSWYAFVMAVDSNHELTGEYAYTVFDVQEEEPTDDFKKWIGTWTATQGKYSYTLSISSLEANYIYKVEGWETGKYLQTETYLDYLETFYDKGDMFFVSQFIMSYDNETMEQCFLGEFYYKSPLGPAKYLIEDEGVDIAYATMEEDGKATISPCDLEAYVEGDSEPYVTQYYDMKYFVWSTTDKAWYHYNDEVAIFPITMTKVEAAPTSTKAPELKRGTYNRPLRGKVFVPKSQKKAVKAVKL